jgi:hypothetical protein
MKTIPLMLVIPILALSTGCSSWPWRSKKVAETAEYEDYLDQATSNTIADSPYRTTVIDGSTLPPPIVSPSNRVAEAEDGDCKDGCCH